MRKFWTEAENELIRLHYPDKKTDAIVCFFKDRTARVIQQHAAAIGVKKSEAFMKSPESGRISKQNDIGVNTRFSHQMPGWNKGKKQADYMSAEAIANTAKTRFKRGQDPHNTQPIGYERITKDGYVEVKVRHLKDGDGKNKNFELKQRLIWEQKNGPIPDGGIIEFLDGDKLNFEDSNLVLRTRKENLLRNRNSDSAIVRKLFKVKEPELVAEIIKKIPAVIECKRKILKIKSDLNESKRKINPVTNG
jgi:hypothetical protein